MNSYLLFSRLAPMPRTFFACLALLFSIEGVAAPPHRLVIAQKRNVPVTIIAGQEYSLVEGIQVFSENLSRTASCEVLFVPDVPVGTLIHVAESLNDLSVTNITWSVLGENTMDDSITKFEVKVIGRCADQVSVIPLEDAPPPLSEGDGENAVVQTNSAVLNSCKQIALGVEKVLPKEFIIRGPVYVAKGESGMFRTEQNGYYVLAVAWSDPYKLLAGRSTKLILTFLHPSYVFTAPEKDKARGQAVVANDHVIIHVMGDCAKTWPTIAADLSRSFVLSVGLEFGSGKDSGTGNNGTE